VLLAAAVVHVAGELLFVADWGQPGWLVLAALFLLPAAAAVPVTRWALRTRAVAPAA
jgi:hypothetical protein